jgi:hypothetical protein
VCVGGEGKGRGCVCVYMCVCVKGSDCLFLSYLISNSFIYSLFN